MTSERLVVVYERVSSAKQDVARQAVQRERAQTDYPDREPLVIQDDGVSAFKVSIFDRPGGRELCELVGAGRVEAIYCDSQDRLSRGKLAEWVNFKALCEDSGSRIVIDGREMRADDETDEILGALDAIRARRESKEKSHRGQGAARLKAERGRFNGGPAPLGYRHRTTHPETGRPTGGLVPEPAEAIVVLRIFEDAAAGVSQRQIARDLDRDGLRTKRGGNWSQAVVRRILVNPFYKGVRSAHGKEHPGEHEGLVSPELWERAKNYREALAKSKGGGRGQVPLGRHLFRHGLLRCGRCGEAMIPRTIRPRSKTGRWGEWYLCYRRVRLGPEGCSRTPVPRASVDSAVLDFFSQVALDIEATRQQLAEASGRTLAEARAAREQAEREMMTAAQAVHRIRGYVRDGRLDPEELEDAKRDESAAVAQVEQLQERERQAEVQPLSNADEELVAYLTKLRGAIAGHIQEAEGLDAVRAALVSFFDALVIHDSDTDSRFAAEVDLFIEPVIRHRAPLVTLKVPAHELQTNDTNGLTM